jgi:hypothetical protein
MFRRASPAETFLGFIKFLILTNFWAELDFQNHVYMEL